MQEVSERERRCGACISARKGKAIRFRTRTPTNGITPTIITGSKSSAENVSGFRLTRAFPARISTADAAPAGVFIAPPAEAVTLRSFRPYPSPSSSQRRAPSCQTSGIPHGVSPISRRIPIPTRLCRCFVKNTRKPWRNPALSA